MTHPSKVPAKAGPSPEASAFVFRPRSIGGLALTLLLAAAPVRAEEAASVPAPAPAAAASTTEATPPAATSPAVAPAAAPAPATAPAPAATEAAPAPVVEAAPAAPKNRSLTYALELAAKGKGDDALTELKAASELPGNDVQTVREITAARAQALLVKKKPEPAVARALIVELLHDDPEAKLFATAIEAAKSIVADLLANQPLVQHEKVESARPGRPLKLRARVIDPKSRVTKLVLHFRPAGSTSYTEEAFTKSTSGYQVFLRDPDALAPTGVNDDYAVEYFVSARDATGAIVDTYPPETKPVAIAFSNAKVDAASKVDLTKLEVRDQPIVPVKTVEPDQTPWYLQWYTLTGAGVVVVGAVVAIVVIATRPPPLPEPIGQITLPLEGGGAP